MTADLRLPATMTQQAYASAPVMAAALARHVASALRAAILRRGAALLLLSGGRSPVALFEQLSQVPLEWSRLVVSLVDERCVAEDSADRNDALVRRHLLQGAAAQAHFVPLVEQGLDAERELPGARRRVAQLALPADVVVLGIGEDGHTASWFPGAAGTAAAMDATTAEQVSIVRPQTAPHARLTLTLPVILQARQILLPLQGDAKREVLERAAAPGADAVRLPVAAVLRQTATPLHLYHCP